MERKTLKAEYEAAVAGPGKFEGEPAYVPYLWDLVLEGGQDEDVDDCGVCVSIFRFQPKMLDGGPDPATEMFPELRNATVSLWEDSQGFVHHEIHWGVRGQNG